MGGFSSSDEDEMASAAMLARSRSVCWRGSLCWRRSLCWRESNGILGLRFSASSINLMEEISAFISGVWSGARGRRASALRVRRGGTVILMSGAEQ